ncbi:MAG: ATP-binding response regulator [Thiobacillus sp.]
MTRPGSDQANDVQDLRVLEEQVRTLHRYLPPILAVHLLVGGVMVATLWNTFPGISLKIWALAMLAMLLLRGGLYLHYRRHATPGTTVRHSRYFVAGAALAGMLWGAAGVLFYAPSMEYQLFVLFILVSMGAGAISSLTAYMPAFYAYFPVSMLPINLVLLNSQQPLSVGLGLMALAYIAALSFFAHNISRSLTESLRLRFENVALVNELSAQKDEAEQANVAKSRFLAAASHDLRQPLHALALYVSLLDDVAESPRVRELVNRINRSISTLQTLFNALLDISKLEAGTLVPERESFDLQPLLERLANDYAVEAAHKRLHLAIPPCAETVHSDPALLEQVLRNYLSNALRYTEHGEVRLDATRIGDHLRLDVVDSGIGIEAAQQRLIFEEFYQVGTSTRDRSQGLGLGLAIVARVARLLDHAITVQSVPGQGSTFSVSVPLGKATRVRAATAARADDALTIDRPLCIVVIDDDAAVRESTRIALDSWGCETIVAPSLDAALVQLTDSAPDGIIADYRLGGGRTGIEAIHVLHNRYGARPGIIISGDVAAAPLRDLQESGLQLLHKPVAPARLRVFLNSVRRAAFQREADARRPV